MRTNWREISGSNSEKMRKHIKRTAKGLQTRRGVEKIKLRAR